MQFDPILHFHNKKRILYYRATLVYTRTNIDQRTHSAIRCNIRLWLPRKRKCALGFRLRFMNKYHLFLPRVFLFFIIHNSLPILFRFLCLFPIPVSFLFSSTCLSRNPSKFDTLQLKGSLHLRRITCLCSNRDKRHDEQLAWLRNSYLQFIYAFTFPNVQYICVVVQMTIKYILMSLVKKYTEGISRKYIAAEQILAIYHCIIIVLSLNLINAWNV